jgi:hypothetical protein
LLALPITSTTTLGIRLKRVICIKLDVARSEMKPHLPRFCKRFE